MSAQTPYVSIIVPVFNESQSLCKTLIELVDMLESWNAVGEIIIVDDGSTDGSGEKICAPNVVTLVSHRSNRGYGAALKTGIRHAEHSLIVIIDADGTYPVSAIPRLVSRMDDCDMVVGSRTGSHVSYSLVRSLPKVFLKVFAEWITAEKIPDLNSGLRVFRRTEIASFERLLPNRYSFTTTLTVAMLNSGLRVHFEPVDYAVRTGRSKFRPIIDTWNMGVTILRLGVYFAPLKVFLPVAVALGGVGSWTLAEDVFVRRDLTERTLILWMAAMHVGMLALLADTISRRRF